jgi:hypothetical protein
MAIDMNLQASNLGARFQRRADMSRPPRRWIIWLVSIGIFLPYTVGDTGKYVIALLFLPAFVSFFSQGKRQVMACDIFVWAASLWMVAVKIGWSEQSGTLTTTASDALGLIGSYMVARSFIYGEPSVREFVRALKVVVIVVVALSLLDTLSGTYFISGFIGKIFTNPRPYRAESPGLHRSLFGFGVLRAASTFAHPILYGTFCSVAAAIFLSYDRSIGRRAFYCGVCLIGCLLSVSSAPILGFALIVLIDCYDRFLYPHPRRWTILYIFSAFMICISFVLSNNPLTWLLRNVTADPADAYYRLLIWQGASDYIALSPIVGADSITWSTNEILGNTIDSLWLVLSLSYGLPMVALLLLASLSACGVLARKINRRLISSEILRIRTGFSLVLFLFAYLGLTVHFWGGIWMFWALCLGIRTSLEEYCLAGSLPTGSPKNLRPTGPGKFYPGTC